MKTSINIATTQEKEEKKERPMYVTKQHQFNSLQYPERIRLLTNQYKRLNERKENRTSYSTRNIEMNSNDAMDLGTMTIKKSNTVNDTNVFFNLKTSSTTS